MPDVQILRPNRMRCIQKERPFAWLPCRLLTSGILQVMDAPAKLLYLHLALAADRRGLSYWGSKRIQHVCDLTPDELHQARQHLERLDLLACDGHTFQLLSLPQIFPPTGCNTPTSLTPCSLPAPSMSPIHGPSSTETPSEIPEQARAILQRLFGVEFPA